MFDNVQCMINIHRTLIVIAMIDYLFIWDIFRVIYDIDFLCHEEQQKNTKIQKQI